MGQGGNLTATDRIRNVLRKKIKKYSAVKKLKVPLVILLYEGDWVHISRHDLEWALWGQLQAIISPAHQEARLSVDTGGLFMPGPNGEPQNTRLSAVVYCRRQWIDNVVHATLFVYHHPSARYPVSDDFFRPLPQCRLTIREAEFDQYWQDGPEGEIQILPLP